jgi:hypothetical protein
MDVTKLKSQLRAHWVKDIQDIVADAQLGTAVGSGSGSGGSGSYTAGTGIDITGNIISVDVTDIINTNQGLSESGNTIKVARVADGGVAIDGTGRLQIDVTDIFDDEYGLSETGNNLIIHLDTDSGLDFDAGDGHLVVNAGPGLDIASNAVRIGVPTTLTTSTTNQASGTTHEHAITSTTDGLSDTDTLLRSSAYGNLLLNKIKVNEVTDYDGASDLTIAPTLALDLRPDGDSITFDDADLVWESDNFLDDPLTISGLRIANNGSKVQLSIGRIKADELEVRMFTADEVRVNRGEEWWAKSYGIVQTEFDTPTAIDDTVAVWFEDSPVYAGQVFDDGDWVMIQYFDDSSGLSIERFWFVVVASSYLAGTDRHRLTLRLKDGSTSGKTIQKGALGIGMGASGQGYIYLSTLDSNDGPYIQTATWSSNPYTAGNRTAHTRYGNLEGILDYGATQTWGIAAGNDLSVNPSTHPHLFDGFSVDETNGLRLFNSAIELYNSGTKAVEIQPDGDVWFGADVDSGDEGISFYHQASSGKIRIGDISAGYMIWDPDAGGAGVGQLLFKDYDSGSFTTRVYVDTDGRVKAGSGSVWLDENGIGLYGESATYAVENALTFNQAVNGDVLSRIYSTYVLANFENILAIESGVTNPQVGNIRLRAYNAASTHTLDFVVRHSSLAGGDQSIYIYDSIEGYHVQFEPGGGTTFYENVLFLEDLLVDGIMKANGDGAITSNPSAADTTYGWKMALRSSGTAIGVAEGTSEQTLALKGAGWLGYFQSNPSDDATATSPDGNALFAVNDNYMFTSADLGEAWNDVTIDDTAEWGNKSVANYHKAQYKRHGDLVMFRGVMKNKGGSTANADVLFTLPAGYRPDKEIIMSTVMNGSPSDNTDYPCRIQVDDADGKVRVYTTVGIDKASGFLALDGLSFSLADA